MAQVQQAQQTWVHGALNDGASSDGSGAASMDSAMRDYLACCSTSDSDGAEDGNMRASSLHRLHNAWQHRHPDEVLSGAYASACSFCMALCLLQT